MIAIPGFLRFATLSSTQHLVFWQVSVTVRRKKLAPTSALIRVVRAKDSRLFSATVNSSHPASLPDKQVISRIDS